MPISSEVSLTIANYKCFAEPPQGFETILPINLVIGRNNSGKSALLDLVQYAVEQQDLEGLGHGSKLPRVEIEQPIREAPLRQVFPDNTSDGPIRGNWWTFAKSWIGKRIRSELGHGNTLRFIEANPPFPQLNIAAQLEGLARTTGNPFANMRIRRLSAARDIAPEPASGDESIHPDGRGLTTVIQNFINNIGLPSTRVEELMLKELNTIVNPDANFTRVVTQLNRGNEKWEIYLEEDEKGRIALSHTGNGIKTIILVLAQLYLIPYLERQPLDNYVFAFEELENNLHPALQRRLLAYLQTFAVENKSTFFLTTHSSVAIDLFASEKNAQIIHVTHDRIRTIARRATTYIHNKGICDDLDVRASDLLQANGVVWVEGPSDRLYFNQWVHIWSEGRLKEGNHYQCVFYGGRLLKHLSATEPDLDTESVIKILRVNRNAIVLMDSDRKKPGDTINTTKQRMVTEVQDLGGIAWITAGREVENYLPQTVINARYANAEEEMLEPFSGFADYLDRLEKGEGARFKNSKVLFAESVLPFITKDALTTQLDMAERLESVCEAIDRWNGQPAPAGGPEDS